MNIKKALFSGILTIGLMFSFFPLFVSAENSLDGCNLSESSCSKLDTSLGAGVCSCPGFCSYNDPGSPCGACCLLNAVYNLTDWIFVGLMAISALMIIYGAYLFVTAGQNPSNADKGRNLLMYAAIGIAIAFFSRALPSLVKLVLGV